MVRRLSFYQRLWILLVFSLLCFLAVATFGVIQNRMSEMVSIAKSSGDGLVDYYTHRPEGAKQIRKRRFVKPYLPWDWVFVTGAYLDEIDAEFSRSIYLVFGFVLAVSVLLSCIVFLTNRFLVRALGGSPEYAKAVVFATAGGDL